MTALIAKLAFATSGSYTTTLHYNNSTLIANGSRLWSRMVL